jgi:GxxExxY protein
MEHDSRVTGLVIGCAIEVHKALGPALKEAAYQSAMCTALSRQNINYKAQKKIGVSFDGTKVGDYQPDLIVDDMVVVEIKSVDRLAPVFTSQVISYLKVTGLRVGLILNFRAVKMVHGIKRIVL